MAMPPTKPRLRKREIVLAVAAGGLAAAAAAAILDESNDGAFSHESPVVIVDGQGEFNNLAPFHAISTVGPQDVEITYGDTQSVNFEGSPQALALLEVVVEDGVLVIRPQNEDWLWNWGGLNEATYRVTVPRLDSITLNGSGDIRVDKIEGDSFSATLTQRGDLSIGSLKVDRAAFTINGTGDISAAGTARDTQISLAGRGDISARELQSKTASVLVNGSGDVKLTVDDRANVTVNGPGDVSIAGSAQCSISQQGRGDVDCGGD